MSDNETNYSSDGDEEKSNNKDSDSVNEIFYEKNDDGEEHALREFQKEENGEKFIEILDAPDSLYRLPPIKQKEKISYLNSRRIGNKSIFEEISEEVGILDPEPEDKKIIIGESKTNFSLTDKKGLKIEIEILDKSDLPTKFGYVKVLQSPPYFKKLTQEEKIRRLENFWDEYKKKHRPKPPPPKTTYTGMNIEETKWINDLKKPRNRKDSYTDSEINPEDNVMNNIVKYCPTTNTYIMPGEYELRPGEEKIEPKKEEIQPKPKKEKKPEPDKLLRNTKKELVEMAKDSGVKRLTNKTKKELVEIIKGNINKKEHIIFTNENERKIFPTYEKAAKEMKISKSQIHYKMGAYKIIDGVEWKITKEYI